MHENINNPYLVPMSERSSLAVSSAMEESNMNKMKNSTAYQYLLNKKDEMQSVIDKIAFGGMSLWFLLFAILICILLFSSIGKSK
jgi:hypothetical protein